MITINNLSYFIGSRPIFENADLHIKPKDKIGLIGLNGTGKTTLLRLINGDLTPTSGEITTSNDCNIGFLNQDLLSFKSEKSILEVAMQGLAHLKDLEHQIEDTLKAMETNYQDHLVEKLSSLQEKFEAMGGYGMQAKAEEVLEGIGFRTEDLQRPLNEFSGGWRMRVMLAKLLLEKPALLMLDEPTNHLDLPSIQWIENYIKNYEGAVIVVSHDRKFLDNTSTSTVEVSQQKLNLYPGNFSFFVQEKEKRREIQKNAYENQQKKIRQTERFIERFRAKATKARQVQSKIKDLEKMDKVDDVEEENKQVNFRFSFSKHSGRFVVELENASKSYDENKVLDNTSIALERGNKVALIGANGIGKSTLLRMVAGTEPFEGVRKPGHNLQMAFYAQHQLEALNVENEILEELKQTGTDKTEQELRNILGCFLFQDDDVFKKIKVLSGGEKSRVALAKTLISDANFLVLDEPTNHLDMQSVNILIQALQQYQGSFIIVSHDRYFISQVANKIWYIEQKQLKEYPGTYEEYETWRQKQTEENALMNQDVIQPATNQKPAKSPKNNKNNKTQASRTQQNDLKKAEKKIEEIETEISKLESRKKEIEQEMTKPEVFGDIEKLEKTNRKMVEVENALEQQNQKWEEVAYRIEALENGRGN